MSEQGNQVAKAAAFIAGVRRHRAGSGPLRPRTGVETVEASAAAPAQMQTSRWAVRSGRPWKSADRKPAKDKNSGNRGRDRGAELSFRRSSATITPLPPSAHICTDGPGTNIDPSPVLLLEHLSWIA